MSILSKLLPRGNRGGPSSCSVVIAAAGASSRMQGEDKILAPLGGVPVIIHTLRAFSGSPAVDEIIVVCQAERVEEISALVGAHGIDKVTAVVAGGATRQASVMAGLDRVSKRAKLVAVHDGARPFVTGDVIENAVKTAARSSACVPAVPVVSTIKRVRGGVVTETIDRAGVYEIQTPQIFDADLLRCALAYAKKNEIAVTDDCMAVEAVGGTVHICAGSYSNIKITTPEDLLRGSAYLRGRGATE